jgi:uncharacterized membrane protein
MRSNINMQTPSHKYITVHADAKIIRAHFFFRKSEDDENIWKKRKQPKNDKNLIFPPLFDFCIRPIHTSTHNYKRDV